MAGLHPQSYWASKSGVVPESFCFFLVLGDAEADGAEAGKWRGDACQDVTEMTQLRHGLHDRRGCGNEKQDTNERELSRRVAYPGVNLWKN